MPGVGRESIFLERASAWKSLTRSAIYYQRLDGPRSTCLGAWISISEKFHSTKKACLSLKCKRSCRKLGRLWNVHLFQTGCLLRVSFSDRAACFSAGSLQPLPTRFSSPAPLIRWLSWTSGSSSRRASRAAGLNQIRLMRLGGAAASSRMSRLSSCGSMTCGLAPATRPSCAVVAVLSDGLLVSQAVWCMSVAPKCRLVTSTFDEHLVPRNEQLHSPKLRGIVFPGTCERTIILAPADTNRVNKTNEHQ